MNKKLIKTARSYGRKSHGTVIIEFATAAWLLSIVVLIGVNCMLVLCASWQNDAACRDAVRAAAQRDTKDNARHAAQAAVISYGSAIAWMSSPQVSFDADDFEYEPYLDTKGQPQRSKGPFVRVSTNTTVKMPAPIILGKAGLTDTINLKQSYAFPLLHLPKS